LGSARGHIVVSEFRTRRFEYQRRRSEYRVRNSAKEGRGVSDFCRSSAWVLTEFPVKAQHLYNSCALVTPELSRRADMRLPSHDDTDCTSPRDIKERREAEQALAERRARCRSCSLQLSAAARQVTTPLHAQPPTVPPGQTLASHSSRHHLHLVHYLYTAALPGPKTNPSFRGPANKPAYVSTIYGCSTKSTTFFVLPSLRHIPPPVR